MGCMGNMIGGVVYTVLQLVALACVTVGTPLPILRQRDPGESKHCLTLWGLREDCSGMSYYIPTKDDLLWLKNKPSRMDVYGCNDRKDRAVAASALSIVSILFAFVLLIFGVLMIMGCCSAAVVGPILTFFTAGCIAATFALIASIYLEKFCEPCQNVYFGAKVETDGDGRCLSFDGPPIAAKDVWKYAEGFILLVVAFVFEFLNLLLCLALCCLQKGG